MTFFYKRIFPFIWFGFLAVFFLVALVKGLGSDQTSNLPFLIVPVLMAIIGYRFMQKLMFNLVDEVFDVGDALLVRSGGREERIALANTKNVNYFPYMSPPQVTLSLRRPTVFGDSIVFCGTLRIVPLSSRPIIDDLVDRIDAARQPSSALSVCDEVIHECSDAIAGGMVGRHRPAAPMNVCDGGKARSRAIPMPAPQ
jgi:hypothetical protein